jgi:hypothetical protein
MPIMDDSLDQILEEMARIVKIKNQVHGSYHYGRVLMTEAADQLDTNVVWALRTMRKARRSFEEECKVARRYNSFTAKWNRLDPYHFGDEERRLEAQLYDLMKEGEFEQCQPVLARLEELLDQDLADNIEIGLLLEVLDPEIPLGKGTTLTLVLHNSSAFSIHVDSIVGRSPQATIYVLDFFKGEMKSGDKRKCQLNVIPKVEGDIAVEIEAVVGNDSRLMHIKKGFSLKVEPPAQVVQFVQAVTPNEMRYAQPIASSSASLRAPSSFDPLELVVSGSVDQWTICLSVFAKGRSPIDLSGMARNDPSYVKADGYANLFKALLVMRYDRTVDWESWFEENGFTGEDYTKRCAKLLHRMGFTKDRSVELDIDGSVGSSNIENLIGAMQIASGEIKRQERSRKSWTVEGELDGDRFSLLVEKNVTKDEKGKAVAAVFRIVSG